MIWLQSGAYNLEIAEIYSNTFLTKISWKQYNYQRVDITNFFFCKMREINFQKVKQ